MAVIRLFIRAMNNTNGVIVGVLFFITHIDTFLVLNHFVVYRKQFKKAVLLCPSYYRVGLSLIWQVSIDRNNFSN